MSDDELFCAPGNPDAAARARMRGAATDLLACYTDLARDRSHLLAELLGAARPQQWAHYPDDDVIDQVHGYQFFYHTHSPEDRAPSAEHGHFHLFARIDRHRATIDPAAERHFLASIGGASEADATTASLLCISVDAKGVPNALFTVNRWVTGDHLLSAATTLALLDGFHIEHRRYRRVGAWIKALLTLLGPEIALLMRERDATLRARASPGLLEDEASELLSSMPIDIDRRIGALFDDACGTH